MKPTGHRIFRTNDGRYVLEGHPDAAFLAYTPKDRVPQSVLDQVFPKPNTKPRRAKETK
jgi:hypothetical protein